MFVQHGLMRMRLPLIEAHTIEGPTDEVSVKRRHYTPVACALAAHIRAQVSGKRIQNVNFRKIMTRLFCGLIAIGFAAPVAENIDDFTCILYDSHDFFANLKDLSVLGSLG